MHQFCMPSLGADMECGTIVEWRVAPGDSVRRGQIVAEVETEKSNIEIEIFDDGRIGEILVPVGVEVAVGTPLATVATADEAVPTAADLALSSTKTPETPLIDIAPTPTATQGRVTSPLVRRLAHDLHVDLQTIVPSGKASKVTRADVERAAAAATHIDAPTPSPTPSRPRVSPRARRRAAELGIDLDSIAPSKADGVIVADDLTTETAPAPRAAPRATPAVRTAAGLSAAVGRLMERSKREVPHYYVSDDIDMTPALQWLERANASRPITERMLSAALLLRAVVRAVHDVPEMNGHYTNSTFCPSGAVHLAIAVALRGGGLVAPVVPNAQDLDLPSLMEAMRDVVDRARAGTLRSRDVEAATITVTNLGDRGAASVFGVIIPPQVAIVGFGRVTERAWAHDGLVGARSIVTASLSADHRVSHGHTGARFLGAISKYLSKPEEL